MPEPTVLNRKEIKLLAAYREASKPDQNFILIESYFLAGNSWTSSMQHQLELLAALCVTAGANQQAA